MERHTARRAADMLTDLIVAHVSNKCARIDIYEAMAVRDDLRQIQKKSSNSYNLPAVGDILVDPDSNPTYGSGDVRVTDVYPDIPAKRFEIDVNTPTHTNKVADCNPDCDPMAPVVAGVYVDGSDKVYHFPVDRLEYKSTEESAIDNVKNSLQN